MKFRIEFDTDVIMRTIRRQPSLQAALAIVGTIAFALGFTGAMTAGITMAATPFRDWIPLATAFVALGIAWWTIRSHDARDQRARSRRTMIATRIMIVEADRLREFLERVMDCCARREALERLKTIAPGVEFDGVVINQIIDELGEAVRGATPPETRFPNLYSDELLFDLPAGTAKTILQNRPAITAALKGRLYHDPRQSTGWSMKNVPAMQACESALLLLWIVRTRLSDAQAALADARDEERDAQPPHPISPHVEQASVLSQAARATEMDLRTILAAEPRH